MDIYVIIFVVIVIVILLCMYKNGHENYSPYRHTGGCPPRTGYNYLDQYEQEDYYKKYPYLYPTPQNYIKNMYMLKQQGYI